MIFPKHDMRFKMERLAWRYYRIWGKIWHGLVLMQRNIEPYDLSLGKGEMTSCIPLTQKSGHLDIRASQDSTYDQLERDSEWEELQDKILRVLSYNYYEDDLTVLYQNKKFIRSTSSLVCYDEEMEMESQVLNQLGDDVVVFGEEEIRMGLAPIRQVPEVVVLRKHRIMMRLGRWIMSVVTFRKCRRNR